MTGSEADKQKQKHHMMLKCRREMLLDGILDVLDFDDRSVSLMTGEGALTVEGEALHMTKMSLETGEVTLLGRIDAFFYESEKPKKADGFFSRFRK